MGADAAAGSGSDAAVALFGRKQKLRSAAHFQAAVAVQGSKTLWKGRAAAGSPPGPPAQAAPAHRARSSAATAASGRPAAAAAAAAAQTAAGGSGRQLAAAGGASGGRRSLFDQSRPLRLAPAAPGGSDIVTPDQIQDALEDATGGLTRLQGSLQSAAQWVASGGLQHQVRPRKN